jgi:hypothetical protein
MGGGDMADTVKLLGTRLRDVLAEAEVAREKVKMLEGIVQALSGELEDKKRLLRELTASSGAPGAAAVPVSESSVPVLQSLLSKANGENERLKKDMKTLGAEVLLAQDKARMAAGEADAKEEELRRLRRALEEARAAGGGDDAGEGGGEDGVLEGAGEGEEEGGGGGSGGGRRDSETAGSAGRVSPGNPFGSGNPF